MEKQSLAEQMKQEANVKMTKQQNRQGNAMMVQRIMQMPVEPYEDGEFVYRVVETSGRKSGKAYQTPLAVFQYEGQRYLIAPRRERDWVQNLLAAGACVLIDKEQREQYRAALTLDAAALAATRAYVEKITRMSEQFPFSVRDSDAEIQAKAEQFAVFRLS